MRLSQVLPVIISMISLLTEQAKSVEIVQFRIIGGAETVIQKHPYAVSIIFQKKHICGGAIISKTHILTAAHCFYENKDFYSVYTDYHVLAGSTNILLDSDSKYFKRQDNDVMFEIASLKTHPDYDPENDDNDISILKLLTDLNFSDSIQAINIPDTNFQIQTSDVVYVCGWGQTKVNDTSTSNVLRSVNITVLDWDSCARSYAKLRALSKNMLCAGDRKMSRDACFGDSGGPLVYSYFENKTKETELFIVGVVSWGYKCGDVKYPGVYTNVAKFYEWITNTMK